MRNRCRCCGKKEDNCSWKEKFAQAGLKFTNPRQYIISVMKNIGEPLSAEEVHSILDRDYPRLGIGIATVYRTMELLFRLGFITKIEGHDKISRFTVQDSVYKIFVQCIKCGNLHEIDPERQRTLLDSLKDISDLVLSNSGFQHSSSNLTINGICNNCK